MSKKNLIPLAGLAFIWGGYYIASQQLVHHMSVFTSGIVIRALTMVFLTIVMWRKGELKTLLNTKGIRGRLIMIGILGFSLDVTAFIGLSLSDVGSGTALLKCDIIFVNILSMIIYKTKFRVIDWIYTAVMVVGVFMVMGVTPSNFSFGSTGDIFFILSALFVSINAFVIKNVQHDKKNPPPNNVIAYYNNIVTMILFFITSMCMGIIGELGYMQQPDVLFVGILAGIGQTLIYLLYYYNLKKFEVWIVKVFLLFMPVVAAVLTFILFKEQMASNQILGVVILLAGAFGILYKPNKKKAVA